MTTQVYNAKQIELLAATFPRRAENSFAWGNAISYYLGLPQLRGFWPMSSVNESGNPYDLSGQGRTLTNNNAVSFGVYGLQSFAQNIPANQGFTRATEPGLEITGALTVAVWWNSNVASFQVLMDKHVAAGNQRSFRLRINATQTESFVVSPDGIATTVVTSSVITGNVWRFTAGRFIPSTTLDIFSNNIKTSLAAGIPASIFVSTADFSLGCDSLVTAFDLDNQYTLGVVCADALSDAQINALYFLTRPLFYGT